MNKRVLLIDYKSNLNSRLSDEFYQPIVTITKVSTYDECLERFECQSYDLCLVNIEDQNERDFVIYYLSNKYNQKIAYFCNDKERCFFNNNCNLCKNFNIKSISKEESILDLILFGKNIESDDCNF